MSKGLSKTLLLALILFLSLCSKASSQGWFEKLQEQAQEDFQKELKEQIKKLKSHSKEAGWKYAAPGYTAGEDLDTPEGKKWYEANKEILKNADGLSFEELKKKYPKVFVAFKEGTPDEYAVEHDIEYTRAETSGAKPEEVAFKKFKADVKFLKQVHQFLKPDSRRADYEKMNIKDKEITLFIYKAFVDKVYTDYKSYSSPLTGKGLKDPPYGKDAKKLLEDLERDIGKGYLVKIKEFNDEYNAVQELKKDGQTPPAAEPPKPAEPPKKLGSMSKKEKEALYGCICACTINPTIGVGAIYDPMAWKNASPSCDDSRNGPCVGFGLGCWRRHPNIDSDCVHRCMKDASVDPQSILSEITKTKFGAFSDFIGEARSIIEEYLAKAGLYQKKSDRGGRGINGDFILLAGNFPDDASLGQILFAAASAASAPTSYAEMVREKNRRGDPDRALGLVRAAEAVMPERKGEIQNILAEFAIMMSKASLNIVTDLEFDEGLYLLRKAAEFHEAGESNALGQEIKRLIGNFEMWKKNWETIRGEVPRCLAMIKDKRVCECETLNSEKITPASNSLDIREQASANKWEISWAPGAPRPILQKDRLMADLKQSLEPAKQKCASHPAMKTNDMAQLKGYEQYKFLEKSPYINQEDFRKSSTLPISDEQAIKKAEKLLGEPGLCDCERDKTKGILDTATKDYKYSKLAVDLTANKKSLTLGEYVRVHLSIKSGRKPYSYTITGDLTASERMTQSPGLVTEYPPKTSGSKTVKAVVTDAAGDTRTVNLSFDVLPRDSTVEQDNVDKNKPKDEPKLTVSLSADKTTLKVNERVYVYANVKDFKAPYSLKWGGYAQGLGDQGGKVPFVGAPSPGNYTVIADVTDAGGRSASGSIVLTVIGDTASKPPVTPPPPPERVLSRFWVLPYRVTLTVGESWSFKAYGVYSGDDPEKPVNLTGRASWSPGQVFKAEQPGGYTVTATFEGASGSATVTVKAKPDAVSTGAPKTEGTKPPSQPTPPKMPGWPTTASGYPHIAGVWIEVSGYPSNGSPITITQSGATIVAVGRYAIGTAKIAWKIDGTLTRDGVITGRLVHTEGVSASSPGFAQDRHMTLTSDGNTLDISASSVGGGGAHQLSWRRERRR